MGEGDRTLLVERTIKKSRTFPFLQVDVRPRLESTSATLSHQSKLDHFDEIISPVLISDADSQPPRLFIGSAVMARNAEQLAARGVTHIVNCSASATPDFFPGSISYKSLPLLDSPAQALPQDMLLDIARFIDDALSKGGRVFIHCHKGVSRSTAITMSYLMFKNRWTLEKAYDHCRNCRPTAAPNAGFEFSLLEWERTIREQPAGFGPARPAE
eukprot:TRINITY_DN5277_c0_g1_i2.p1 TRINITY_DN5277_c0_g1~~TRINITY_DN5277_c0_g1_i2.p1  ORF type:complete len:214 (+),score=8.20 TRINITY_DN5277_c0_g1_i2:89-730(+)